MREDGAGRPARHGIVATLDESGAPGDYAFFGYAPEQERELVNVTPVPREGSAAGSVVVTVQDLAPLDEIERLRTKFLGVVSHELRAPLTSAVRRESAIGEADLGVSVGGATRF